MSIHHRIAATLIAALVFAAPAGARTKAAHPVKAPPEPVHNFVEGNLGWPTPTGRPGMLLSITLLDAASVRHEGDVVSFDTYPMMANMTMFDPGAVSVKDIGNVHVYRKPMRVSCAWRTIHPVIAPGGRESEHESILPVDHKISVAVDRICAGGDLKPAAGAATLEDAVAHWKEMFEAPGLVAYTMLPQPPSPPPAPWMHGPKPAAFVRVAQDSATGRQLFIDAANLVRDGDTVTALAFAMLGPQARRAATVTTTVSALYRIDYDCAARSLTIRAEADWQGPRYFSGAREVQSPQRLAGESAIAAAQIDAVCGGNLPTSGAFDSYDAAWYAAP